MENRLRAPEAAGDGGRVNVPGEGQAVIEILHRALLVWEAQDECR